MKKEEERITKYSKYNEDITPIKTHIVHKYGNFVFLFEINGYKGNDTGEIYYSRDEALRMERIISMYIGDNGHESYFEIPQIMPDGEPLSSRVALDPEKSFSGVTQ